jgi:undecaprenyl diphosphate synthase
MPNATVTSPHAQDPEAQRIVAALQRRNPNADPLKYLPDVHPGAIPRHIAIIMDGNGRWATQRGLPRPMGHQAGAPTVKRVIEMCGRLGVEVVTLYSFSLENWKRPPEEVNALMALYIAKIESERELLMRENVRFVQIGRREGLPKLVLEKADELMELTKRNTAATLCLAVNYGSRAELSDAMQTIAHKVKSGAIAPEQIDEALIEKHLYTAGLPDPDLLIRTAGEMRISNYLLWQISYAELYVTPVLWPDFSNDDLLNAIREYARRTRKFGAVIPP